MLIDLDQRTPPRPRSRPRATWRWKPLLAAALLLALGGAAPPPPAASVTEVATTGGEAVMASVLTGDALFAALLPDPQGGRERPEIWAIPVRPGGPRWIVDGPQERPELSMDATGSLLLATFSPVGPLVVLDARTGRERWRSKPQLAPLVLGDRVALLEWGRLTMADLATGKTLWSVASEAAVLYGDAQHLIAVDSDGRARARSVADGRPLTGPRDIGIDPESWDGDYPEPFTAATVLDGRLYVYGTSFVAEYRPGDLTRLWRTPVSRPPVSLGACGDAVCAQGPKGVTVLDAATGAVRWTDPRWQTVTADGSATGDDGTAARVDPATGRVLRDLGRAVVAGDLVLRTDRDNTWVTRLGDGRVIGSLPFFAPATCIRQRPYLACPADGQAMTVWRVDGG